jgi:hypothetical protein
MWLRREFKRKEVKPDFTQFLTILMDDAVGIFDYFNCFCDDEGMVSMDT